MPASAPLLDGEKEYEDIEQAAIMGIKKSGLVLADPEIIRAMDAEGGGIFIPARLKKDGTVSSVGASAKTLEEFDELQDKLKDTIRAMGDRLISGDMCIKPIKDGSINACRYCEFKAFCRKQSAIWKEAACQQGERENTVFFLPTGDCPAPDFSRIWIS